jgi:hypothetical protein
LGVALQCHTKKGGYAIGGTFVDHGSWNDMGYAQKEDFVMAWVRQVRRPDVGQGATSLAVDPVWVHEFPALHEHLVLSTHSDGAERRTSTLTLFCELGTWKCFLNERDTDASLCASGDTIANTLSALEVMLEAENVPWRFHDRPRGGNSKKGRHGS